MTRLEWPTIALTLFIHGAWLVLTWHAATLAWWIACPAGAVLIAWHSSLQHELIHGHPTGSRAVNDALASVPLSLWLPFPIYRDSHLQHHRDAHLTDPLEDPESRYVTPAAWAGFGALRRAALNAQMTLAGRLLIGPFWSIGGFLIAEAAHLARSADSRRIWTEHIALCLPVLLWLGPVCHVGFAYYMFGMVLPGTSLLLIRSFAEHRAAADPARRTAVVEGSWLLGPLFLFNNLHAAHHAAPGIPWYRLPRWYHAHRAALLHANGGLVYRGYADLARRFLLRRHDSPALPGRG